LKIFRFLVSLTGNKRKHCQLLQKSIYHKIITTKVLTLSSFLLKESSSRSKSESEVPTLCDSFAQELSWRKKRQAYIYSCAIPYLAKLQEKEIKCMWNKAWFHSFHKTCGIKGLFCSYCNQSQILRLNDIPHRLIIFKINGNKGITIVALTRNTGFNFQQHQILQVFERLGETKLKINSSISAVL